MYWLASVAALPFLLTCVAFSAEKEEFVPFPVDWQSDANSPADLSFLLEAPAGKDGHVRVADGRLVRGDGKRLRIWGVNATMGAGTPAKEHAPLIARRLAQSGVNCVRFHFLDVLSPRGILDANRDDTRAFDAGQVDRLDYFVGELKKRGIYANLNLNVGRSYKAGDGVRDHELLGFAKSLTYFDPRLIELQKEYARMLLTHRNPYTQGEYRHEPAVAMVELMNENSLVESWFSGRLLGRNTTRNPGTWTDIPASYERALTEAYNAWLRGRLSEKELADLRTEAGAPAGEALPRLQPAQFAKASRLRFQTEAAFYIETERRYFQDMAKYLREELGVKSPLIGSSDHNHGRSGYPHLSSTCLLDVVDGHVYWQHPNYLTDPNSGRRTGFSIANTPMVADPLRSTPVQLSRSAMAGKPYTVSEVNHPFPNEYACEGVPILAAYAAFQDWDGIFWYTLGHKDPAEPAPAAIGHFDLFPDPVKMAQLRSGALMFLRADVAPARQTISRSYSREQVLEGLRLGWSAGPYFTAGFDLAIPLTHAVRVQSFDGPPTGQFGREANDPIRCDTGELVWHHKGEKQALVVIETARSQALIGFCKTTPQTLRNLTVQADTPFCAIALHALDDKPISSSERMLLTACARVTNSGTRWDAKRKSLEQWGKGPACIEPVSGAVVLSNLEGARGVTVQPLDGAGRLTGQEVAATKTEAGWTLSIGKPPTVWYLVRVTR